MKLRGVDDMDAALGGFFQPVGALHTHIFLFRLLNFSVGLGRSGGERRGLDGVRQFGRGNGLVHVLKPQTGLGSARGRVRLLVFHQLFLFGHLGLGRVRFISNLVSATDMLLQPGISALGIGELEPRIFRLAHRSASWVFLSRPEPGGAGIAAFFCAN